MQTSTMNQAVTAASSSAATTGYVKRFNEIGIDDIPLVGGKNASLGEMYRALAPKGVKVPDGFAITAEAYRYFLRQAGLDVKIDEVMSGLDTRDLENLRQRASQVREAILSADLPEDLEGEIQERRRLRAGRSKVFDSPR